MSAPKLTFEFVGYHWPWSGDLFYMTNEDNLEARVLVDSLGETWVDVRAIPEGGFFHSERVVAYRSYDTADRIAEKLAACGFGNRKEAYGAAGRVQQKGV